MSNDTSFELAKVIQALRENLIEAQSQGHGQNIKFNATNVEIEIQTVVKKDAQAKSGVKFWVIEAGASGGYEKEAIQKIKLSLQAVEIDPITGQQKNTLLAGEEE